MRTSWGIRIFLALSGYTGAFSQGLLLDSLIHMGIRNNPDLLVSMQEGEVAASDTLTATAFKNPVLDFEAGYNVTDPGKPKATVRLSKEFQPGVRSNQYLVSKASLAAKRQSQKSGELELAMEIRSAYFTWQILSRKKALQAEVEKRWASLSRIASVKMKEGRLSQVDEAQAQLNRARARQKEMGFQAAMGSVEKRLAYLTGMKESGDSIAVYSIDTPPELHPLDSLSKWAVGENAELKMLDLEIEAEKRKLGLEKSLRNPPLTVSIGYDKETDGNNVVGGGLAFPIPLFNRNQAGLAKSRAELRLTESRRAATDARLKTEIADLHARLGRLAERYQSYQNEIRTLGSKQLELSEKGFLQGLLGIFELSRVQEEFLSQEMDALDILEAYYDLWNRLGMAVGGKTW
jgi:outer membrane protein, heavy metal efflux system